ncbi:MAG: response regulator transcription factor [Actinobacteria bacterium]|nr:response regulator transcription factor [Actinomycetota bacterium]
MDKIRVLLVDDHTILREGIKMLLEAQPDVEVVGEAEDGEEAVAKARALKPDVVLMDVAMPKLNGLEATRQIKKEDPGAQVLILSMHETEEYILPILEAGASGYVVKQTAAQELVSAIRAVYNGNSFLYPTVARKVIESFLRRSQPAKPDPAHDVLTERELEILKMVAEGLTNQQIAEKLFLSIKTVQAHRANIMEKLDIHDRVELVKYAIRNGLVDIT